MSVWSILIATYALAELTLGAEVLAFVYVVLGLVSLYLQLFLTSAALSCAFAEYRFDPREPTKGRLPGVFLLSVVWLFGVAAGLVLLVLPGLVLLVRWSVCVPILLAENATAIESLRRSWNLTRLHWKIASLVVGISSVPFAAFIALALQYPLYEAPSVVLALATNFLYATASVLSWLMSCALYALLQATPRGQAA